MKNNPLEIIMFILTIMAWLAWFGCFGHDISAEAPRLLLVAALIVSLFDQLR